AKTGPPSTAAHPPATSLERLATERLTTERLDGVRPRAREHARDAIAAPSEPVRDEVVLDPSARSLAQLAPPATPAAATTVTEAAPPPARALDPTVMAAVVETAAFWGDGARGLARLRFGHRARGGLSGATVTLVHDDDAVSVRVEGAD